MEIIETFFRKDRFFVKVMTSNGQRTYQRANFVWLQENPSFKEIPKGYVVHHLDWDKSNDDISNLVIMQKFHHAAHHWKNKTITSTVITDRSMDTYCPVKKPSIYPDGEYFRVYFREIDGETGKQKPVIIYSDEDGVFKTIERAEGFVKRIWKEHTPSVESFRNEKRHLSY